VYGTEWKKTNSPLTVHVKKTTPWFKDIKGQDMTLRCSAMPIPTVPLDYPLCDRLIASVHATENGGTSLTSGTFIELESAAPDAHAHNRFFLVCGFAKPVNQKNKDRTALDKLLGANLFVILAKVSGMLSIIARA